MSIKEFIVVRYSITNILACKTDGFTVTQRNMLYIGLVLSSTVKIDSFDIKTVPRRQLLFYVKRD